MSAVSKSASSKRKSAAGKSRSKSAPGTASGTASNGLTTLNLDTLVEYEDNPRQINQRAIDAVAHSIEKYGYRQPIVVDSDKVIVVGHTRYRALKQLGYTQAAVRVADDLSPEQAKEYRLIDNRTGELTSWDHDQLVSELREFDQDLLDRFFPEVDLEIGQVSDAITDDDVAGATQKVTAVTQPQASNMHTTVVVCPACEHRFDVRTRTLPGLTYEDIEALAQGDDG